MAYKQEEGQKQQQKEIVCDYTVKVSGGFSGGKREHAHGEVNITDNGNGKYSVRVQDANGRAKTFPVEIKKEGSEYSVTAEGKAKIAVPKGLIGEYIKDSGAEKGMAMAMRDSGLLGAILVNQVYKNDFKGEEFSPNTSDGYRVSVDIDTKKFPSYK
jgi:hypothetical protein